MSKQYKVKHAGKTLTVSQAYLDQYESECEVLETIDMESGEKKAAPADSNKKAAPAAKNKKAAPAPPAPNAE